MTPKLVQNLGADATIDYHKNESDQLEDLKATTRGNFFRIFDTVAKSADFALRALKEISSSAAQSHKFFTTTNDWYVYVHDNSLHSHNKSFFSLVHTSSYNINPRGSVTPYLRSTGRPWWRIYPLTSPSTRSRSA